jgi:type I restriction enzyme S subunit
LRLGQVYALPILWCPLEEQRAIVRDVRAASNGLERARRGAEQEIGLLREYRTRLIADVVTGKLDVREAAAQLPEEAEGSEPLVESEAFDDAAEESAANDLDPQPEEAEA